MIFGKLATSSEFKIRQVINNGGMVGSIPSSSPSVLVRFPAGSGILISILKLDMFFVCVLSSAVSSGGHEFL